MKAFGIIGANFGDEGKGGTTAFLAKNHSNSITVRSSGGAQTSHTVEFNGKRHAFRSISSGTWFGSDTYLSEYFISNPIVFMKEHRLINPTTSIFVHRNSRLTLPFDMMINQCLENARGNARHGSCGMGINETVIRCETEFKTFYKDITKKEFREKLIRIRDQYHLPRFTELGLDIPEHFSDDAILEKFIADCNEYVSATKFADNEILKNYETILFEGNQGLLLDEHHHFFPHVTRSRTGMTNASKILKSIGVNEVEVFYCSRGYLTRHGAGPLPFETEGKIYPAIEDKTNIPNDFQGSIRFAPLNLTLLKEAVKKDIEECEVKIIPSLAISCVDQLPEIVKYVEDGQVVEDNIVRMIQKMTDAVGANVVMYHCSPDVTTSYIW